jgi:hypothetical protein
MQTMFSMPKAYILATVALLLWILGICYAFYPGVLAYQQNKELNAQINNDGELSYQPTYLQRKNKNLDKVLLLYQTDHNDYRSLLLSTLSAVADKEQVAVVEVPQDNSAIADSTQQYTILKVGMEGDYRKLTRFYDQLQGVQGLGRIRSALYTRPHLGTMNNTSSKLRLYLFMEVRK